MLFVIHICISYLTFLYSVKSLLYLLILLFYLIGSIDTQYSCIPVLFFSIDYGIDNSIICKIIKITIKTYTVKKKAQICFNEAFYIIADKDDYNDINVQRVLSCNYKNVARMY